MPTRFTCPHCAALLEAGPDSVAGVALELRVVTPGSGVPDDNRLSAILGRAVARQADTIAAQADQIVSLSKR